MKKRRPLQPNPNVEGIDSVAEFKIRKAKADTVWFGHGIVGGIGMILATTGTPSDTRIGIGIAMFLVAGVTGFYRFSRLHRCPACERSVSPRRQFGPMQCYRCGALLSD